MILFCGDFQYKPCKKKSNTPNATIRNRRREFWPTISNTLVNPCQLHMSTTKYMATKVGVATPTTNNK
jgi:hypothetical protein